MLLAFTFSTILLILIGAIAVLILFWFLRYAWLSYSEKTYEPVSWREACRQGSVSPRLRKLEKNYADKIRFFNFWIQARHIEDEGIEGDIAELGVYKGETAAILHALFPWRKLHLFDTFEGFPETDLEGETGKAAEYTSSAFRDTSEAAVRETVDGGEMVRLYKGCFPESANDIDARFALVSMDADLYKPTKAGLDIFWARLQPGGVILVHDYTPDWPGITRAVAEFRAETRCLVVPLPDQNGTVMLFKDR